MGLLTKEIPGKALSLLRLPSYSHLKAIQWNHGIHSSPNIYTQEQRLYMRLLKCPKHLRSVQLLPIRTPNCTTLHTIYCIALYYASPHQLQSTLTFSTICFLKIFLHYTPNPTARLWVCHNYFKTFHRSFKASTPTVVEMQRHENPVPIWKQGKF